MNTLHHTTICAGKLRKSRFILRFMPLLAAATLLTALAATPEITREQNVTVKIKQTSEAPQAVVLSVVGNCTFADDGVTFKELKTGRVISQGAVVRSGPDSRTDLFFRRIGTTVRLQEKTEVSFEKMARHIKDGMPVMETLLDLRAGRIFTVVRSLVPGSTFEIRNAAGRSVVEGGGGKGRYIITADGTHVADKQSSVPLKLVRETGITIITPGQKFDAREGKLFAAQAPDEVDEMIDLDEIQSLAEQLTPSVVPAAQDDSEALVLAVGAKSTFSKEGGDFKRLRVGQVLTQGAVVRAGDDNVVDLFLRRWGTTVRLMQGTELSLDKMSRQTGAAPNAMQTHLDLRKGRIFCFIRIPQPGSVFEVKTKAGRSVLKSAGAGRYDIRDDGTIVAGKNSFKHLEFSTDKGIVMITPGQKFTPQDGHMTPAAPSEVEMMMIQIDELAALAEELTLEATPPGGAEK